MKRFLALLLTVCMVFGLLPAHAESVNGEMTIWNNPVFADENGVNLYDRILEVFGFSPDGEYDAELLAALIEKMILGEELT